MVRTVFCLALALVCLASGPVAASSDNRDYAQKTFALDGSGGSFSIPVYAGFAGTANYSAVTPGKSKLTFANAGSRNAFGAPQPTDGTPVLYMRASVGSKRGVSFRVVGGELPPMTIASSALQAGVNYALDAFQAGTEVATYAATTPQSGTLTFPSPFENSKIADSKPLEYVLVSLPSERLLVADEANDRTGGIRFFNADGGYLSEQFIALPQAQSVTVDDSQNVYGAGYVGNGPVVYEYPANGDPTVAYYNDRYIFQRIATGAGASAQLDVANENNLLLFPQGVNSPSIFNDPFGTSMNSVTIDGASNGYVGGMAPNGIYEVDFLKTNSGTYDLNLQLVASPRALAVDPQGNLVVAECCAADGSQTGEVAVFRPGSTIPFRTFRGGAFDIAFGNGGQWLYVLSEGAVAVAAYNYADGFQVTAFGLGYTEDANGIAIQPRAPLFIPGAYQRRHAHYRYWTDFQYRKGRLVRPLPIGGHAEH